MPGFSFDRPVGAGADVKELQYIIALHQTSLEPRENSTVSSLDIMALLKSRYGLTITDEQAIELTHGFGGGDNKSPDEAESSELSGNPDNPAFSESPDESESKALRSTSVGSRMKQLHKIHSRNQKGSVGQLSMLAHREKITEELAAQVRQASKAHLNLSKDCPEDIEHFAADSEAADPNGKEASATIKKNPPSSQPNSFSEIKGEGPLPAYLDMIQVLSILLTPKFAKLAQDVANEPKETAAPDQEGDFHDDEKFEYSASKVLEICKTALLKSLPDTQAPVVNETLVKLLLISHGEVERANDEHLIAEMVAAAATPSGVLDQASLIKAISSDLGLWDPHCQDTNTSFFYDVFGIQQPSVYTKLKTNTGKDDDGNSSSREARVNGTNESPSKPAADEANAVPINTSTNEQVKSELAADRQEPPKLSIFAKCCKFFFPVYYKIRLEKLDFGTAFLGIDSVIDTAESSMVAVLIWIWYILNAVVYGALITLRPDQNDGCPSGDYWCVCKSTIVSWSIIAIMLILMGCYLILPLSVGNNPANLSPRRLFFSCVMAAFNTILPFWFLKGWAERNLDKIDDEDIRLQIETKSTQVFAIITLVFGCFLFLMFLIKGLFLACVDHKHPHRLPRPLRMIVGGSSWSSEARVYNAAKIKIDKLVFNAVRLHDSDHFRKGSVNKMTLKNKLSFSEAIDQASRNFILHGESKESVGGVMWTFWRLVDGSLYDVEGIWIHSRLVIIQVTQVILGIIITIALLLATYSAADEADAYREEIKDDDLPDWVMEIFPTGSMIKTAFIPATFVAMAMIVFIFLVYIPSSVTTVLKFRAQVISSLGAGFQKYRISVDHTYMNTANALWGLIGSGILFYIVIGLIIFLYVWPVTRDLLLVITAWGVGLGITITIKMVITSLCRKAQYRNFYRIKPAAARISVLALECWYIGIAGSVLISRICQFLGAALFWVGRIDVPFLSDDVVLMGYGFDSLPLYYFKDLLVHEAHRHPYIEQLSQMYLMKLRYGDNFLSNAGAVWRQLLIVALFPWLAKHRVFGEERRIMGELDAEEDEEIEKKEEDAFAGIHDIQDDVVRVGTGVSEEVVRVGDELRGAGADVVNAAGTFAAKVGVGIAGADVVNAAGTFAAKVGVGTIMKSCGETDDVCNKEASTVNTTHGRASSGEYLAEGEEDPCQGVEVTAPVKVCMS